MTDNELFGLLIFPVIKAGLTDDGFSGVTTLQAYQPTQQGVPTGATVYVSKQGDHEYGWVKRDQVWNGVNEILTEIQQVETTFNVQSLVIQNPAAPSYTASDLANEVVAILRSTQTIEIYRGFGVGILRITDIGNLYFDDDRDQYEAVPSFNFVLSHSRTRIKIIPVIESTESVFARV